MVTTTEITKAQFLKLYSDNQLEDITDIMVGLEDRKYAITKNVDNPDYWKVVYIVK